MKTLINPALITLLLHVMPFCYASNDLKLNEGLPVMVDSKTELNNILLKDMNVTYTYQLKNISIDEAKNLKSVHQHFIEKNACNDENIQCLFKKDLGVTFIYKIARQEILKVDVNQNFCDRLNQENCVL